MNAFLKGRPSFHVGTPHGQDEAKLELCWDQVGLCWAWFGPVLPYVGPGWSQGGSCWPRPRPCWTYVGECRPSQGFRTQPPVASGPRLSCNLQGLGHTGPMLGDLGALLRSSSALERRRPGQDGPRLVASLLM